MTPETPEAREAVEPEGTETPEVDETEPDTFPREYVERLRREAAEARVKAKSADALAARLHAAQVAATGRLADPSDLPFDEAHLDDPDALTSAIDALLAAKPHLASRRVTGSIDQGVRETPTAPVSWGSLFR